MNCEMFQTCRKLESGARAPASTQQTRHLTETQPSRRTKPPPPRHLPPLRRGHQEPKVAVTPSNPHFLFITYFCPHNSVECRLCDFNLHKCLHFKVAILECLIRIVDFSIPPGLKSDNAFWTEPGGTQSSGRRPRASPLCEPVTASRSPSPRQLSERCQTVFPVRAG